MLVSLIPIWRVNRTTHTHPPSLSSKWADPLVRFPNWFWEPIRAGFLWFISGQVLLDFLRFYFLFILLFSCFFPSFEIHELFQICDFFSIFVFFFKIHELFANS